MAYLQDTHHASRLAEIDRNGVRLVPAIRSLFLKRTAARNVSGHLGVIADRTAAVYVAGGQLWLAIDGQPWFFRELEADVSADDHGWRVEIRTPARTYDFDVERTLPYDDLTPFADPEDFSFGLWAARVIQSPERQQVLLDVLVDAPLTVMPVHATKEEHPLSVDVTREWKTPVGAVGLHSEKKHSL
jgi:hypothetical protein